MKLIKFILLLSIAFPAICIAQQNKPIGFTKDNTTKKEKVEEYKKDDKDLHHFTLYGIGNVSDEILKKLNAGGKIAIGFCPTPENKDNQFNIFVSLNKNASNNDSLISTMLVFPEAGNNSASFTVSRYKFKPKGNTAFLHGPFAEFAFKSIKTPDSTVTKTGELAFDILHYTLGYNWGFIKEKKIEGKEYSTGINFALFVSYVNIPDEDHKNFEKITKLTATKNDFLSLGGKITFQLNGFQIFADIRQVFGTEKKLPLKDLKGFNSNIGVAFNTEIFKF